MNKRNVLQWAAATAVVGLLSESQSSVTAAERVLKKTPAPWPQGSVIERDDGTSLYFRDWGCGKPIFFVHSAAVDSRIFQYQMVALADAGFRCITFDRRSHGRSSDPGRGYDFDTLADDVAAVMDALDVSGATLVGHSMGCGEIVRYLTRHGSERVARIALLAPTLPFWLKTPDHPMGVDLSELQAERATWFRDYPKWVADNAKPFFSADTSNEMIQWGIRMLLDTPLHAIIATNISVTDTDFRAELPRITVPTMILHGTADVSCPIDFTSRRTAALIPNCELKVYDGAPHGLMITHLDRVNEDLLNFAKR